MDSPRLAVVIGGGGDDKSQMSEGTEVFIGGGGRRNGRCFYGSAVVGRENLWQQEPRQQSGKTLSYSLLCLSGPGVGHTLTETEANRKVGSNFEEVQQRRG